MLPTYPNTLTSITSSGYELQHGFRKKKNVNVSSYLWGKQTYLVLFDLSKAFGKVNHLKFYINFLVSVYCKRKYFKLDSFILNRTHTNFCTRRVVLECGHSDLWCATGLCSGPDPLYFLHK